MLVLLYQTHGKYHEAIDYYKQAIETNINHESALYELAYCLDVTDKLEDSLAYYQEFIDRDPYSSYAWYNLGIVFNKLMRFDEAVNA